LRLDLDIWQVVLNWAKYKFFIPKFVSNNLELSLWHIVTLFEPFIDCVYFYSLSNKPKIVYSLLFCARKQYHFQWLLVKKSQKKSRVITNYQIPYFVNDLERAVLFLVQLLWELVLCDISCLWPDFFSCLQFLFISYIASL